MQDIIITVVKKIKTTFEKFDDFVYVHYEKDINGEKCDAFMISRKDFDAREKRHGRNYKWLLSYPMKMRYYAYTQEYLEHYYEGDWGLFHSSFIENDPLPLLLAGDTSRFFHDNVVEDGYLKYDGKRVRRAWTIDFHESRYCKMIELKEYLTKHPRVKKVISARERLSAVYIPSIQEFNKLVGNKDTFTSWDVEESARKALRIPKKFIKTGDDREEDDDD
jgi:hypothetical protein